VIGTGIDIGHPLIYQAREQIAAVKSWEPSCTGEEDATGHGTYSVALLLKVAPDAEIFVAQVSRDVSATVDSERVVEVCRA
jgi:hypothetical protein